MTGGAVLRVAGRLPAEVTSFVGRRSELAEIRRLLESARLVTLLGVGGVGKTRLALRTAQQVRAAFPDGVYFVDLAAVREPGLLAQTVADALDLPDQALRDPLDALAEHLADRRLLLVLDTCEHLVDACAMLVEVLLRAGAGNRVLTTSRQPLDVPGEHTLPVSPLAAAAGGEDEAVTLFAERAAAVVPGFTVTPENRPDVVRLCHRLEGIPLAIELAAVRLRALPIEQIVTRLGDRFLLTGERRTSYARHQTLRGAIRWSHDLCSPAEQLGWARLSVFAGGFDLPAAEAVCAGGEVAPEDVLDVVAGLVDKSVLARDPDGRYRMLDTLREYGAGRLEELGETPGVQRRQLAHYLDRAARAEAELTTSAQPGWFDWTRDEHANLRDLLDRAVRQGDTDAALRLVAGFGVIRFARGNLRETRLWADRVLALPGGDPDLRFRVSLLLALVAVFQRDLAGADTAVETARELAGPGDRPYILGLTGILRFADGDPCGAAELLDKALSGHREAGNTDVMALVGGMYAGLAHFFGGDLARALEPVEALVRHCRAAGEQWCQAIGLWGLSALRVTQGQVEQAEADAQESLRISARLDTRLSFTGGLEIATACAMERGEHLRAAHLYGATERQRVAHGQSFMSEALADIWSLAAVTLREELGAARYEDAYAAGAVLTHAQALALALRETPAVPADPVEAETERLTRREQQIAGLVAEGLSNREIAERLVISKRTVDSHVEHILAKLGFASRTQVAAWITRRA